MTRKIKTGYKEIDDILKGGIPANKITKNIETYDEVGAIIAYEQGELDEQGAIELFQRLRKNRSLFCREKVGEMKDIKQIPTDELLNDYLESEIDIRNCEVALQIGYTHCKNGTSVLERLETNKRIIEKIEEELERRKKIDKELKRRVGK